jgi:UDP-2,3-diacylglucosamine pyrophosphatase LpxH
MESTIYNVIVLSDLHLGSEVSRAREALDLLRTIKFRRLILLGDIFCDLNFRRLNKEHWQFLSYIRKLSNPKRDVEVVWVEGNHDYGLSDMMSHLVGVPVYQEYTWESDGERYLAIHGHQFDNFIVKNHLFMNGLASCIYLSIQKLNSKGKRIARFIDRLNTQWQRLTPKVADGALSYAWSRGATRVFCGHTHDAIAMMKDQISYYNTGAWTHNRPTYISVLGREVTINEYVERLDYRYTGEERREIASPAADFAFEAGLPADSQYESAFS